MSITISDVAILVRSLVMDFSVSRIPGDIYTYGSSNVFTPYETNISAVTGVFINGVSTGSYSFSSSNLKVTVTASLSVGDTVEIQYTYYPDWSDAEIEGFVRSAVIYLSVNNYYTFEVDTNDTFYPDVSNREKNLIAFVASILMKPDNKTIRLPDVTINVPPSLPTRDIIAQAIKIFKHNASGVFDLINTGVAYPSNYYYRP